MDGRTLLASRFEEHRAHLKTVAYRLLGSISEAEDAVQQAWLRLARADTDAIENLGGWLTTVVSRICLDMLRSRNTRAEESLDTHLPDPVVTRVDGLDPEGEVVLADSVGLALQVVLDRLNPAERLAFVLHDMFAVPFDDVASLAGRSSDSVRQLASRARRRVEAAPVPDPDIRRQREAVDAFFAAARGGDFEALVSVLDPDVELTSDGGTARPAVTAVARGAETIAKRATMFSQPDAVVHPVLVNGAAGVLITMHGKPVSLFCFTVLGGKIVRVHVLADPERLAAIDVAGLTGPGT